MATTVQDGLLRRVFVAAKIALHKVAERVFGLVIFPDPAAGGVGGHGHHVLAGGLRGVVLELHDHPVVDRVLLDAQQFAVPGGALRGGPDFICVRLQPREKVVRLGECLENKNRAAGKLLLDVPTGDAASLIGEVQPARHRERERALQRAERHMKIPIRVGALDVQRPGDREWQPDVPDLVLDKALVTGGILERELVKLVPGLSGQPVDPALHGIGVVAAWGGFLSCEPPVVGHGR